MAKSNKEYIKHVVECNCILPQFKATNPPVFHKFAVFSVINEKGDIEPTFVECNNCAAIHKVLEVGKSVQLRKETMKSLPRVDEIKTTIPDAIVKILESYKVDLPTWQEVKFIYDEQKWGRPVILSKEEDAGLVVGKFLLILGLDLYKVDSFVSGEDE